MTAAFKMLRLGRILERQRAEIAELRRKNSELKLTTVELILAGVREDGQVSAS